MSQGIDLEKYEQINRMTLLASQKDGSIQLRECVKDYPDLIDSINENFDTALHVACFHENIECVRVLISECANVEVKDLFGRTPLYIASLMGNYELVEFLLDCEADPNSTDHRGNNTLHAACASKKPSRKILLALLTKNADPTQLNVDYHSPCHVAKIKSPESAMMVQVISNYLPVEDALDELHDQDTRMLGIGLGVAMGVRVIRAYKKECKRQASKEAKKKALADAEWEDMKRSGVRRPSVYGSRNKGKPGSIVLAEQRRLTQSEKDADVILRTVVGIAKHKPVFMPLTYQGPTQIASPAEDGRHDVRPSSCLRDDPLRERNTISIQNRPSSTDDKKKTRTRESRQKNRHRGKSGRIHSPSRSDHDIVNTRTLSRHSSLDKSRSKLMTQSQLDSQSKRLDEGPSNFSQTIVPKF